MEDKYSIWLMPQSNVGETLGKLIKKLARKYKAPVFLPHVTLIGSLTGEASEIVEQTRKLASLLKPYDIRLTRADCLDEYFRCLFMRVEETREVMDAFHRAVGIFPQKAGAGPIRLSPPIPRAFPS